MPVETVPEIVSASNDSKAASLPPTQVKATSTGDPWVSSTTVMPSLYVHKAETDNREDSERIKVLVGKQRRPGRGTISDSDGLTRRSWGCRHVLQGDCRYNKAVGGKW